jgi:hypothetical protein
MMKVRVPFITSLVTLMVMVSMIPTFADPDKHDIGSGGLATISNAAFGGSVISNPGLLADLVVTVNFGEITPINTDPIIKVIIPVAIRSRGDYQVAVSVTGTLGTEPEALKLSDIGLGVRNLRSLGARAEPCGINSVIRAPYNNDPATSVTINSTTGRAEYPSSLANIAATPLILNGPTLSTNTGNWRRGTDNGYAFDLILAVVPQWYAAGSFNLTLTLAMSAGPNFNCP